MRRWTGKKLRRLADWIDPVGAPRLTHWTFTFERGEGVRFREDGRGCRVAYLGEEEYERAHTESDSTRRGNSAPRFADLVAALTKRAEPGGMVQPANPVTPPKRPAGSKPPTPQERVAMRP